jgi:RNA polymerase sigma factor (sigma-70 family)
MLPMTTDSELLERYAESHSEDAFTELVHRHVNFVYSAALRQVNGDTHLAQDVAQSVFTDLARKAAALARRPMLTGWLYTSTHFAAAKAVRSECRRHAREQEAHIMRELLHDSPPEVEWEKVRPVLDAAMLELKEPDRDAVLLRFFENRPLADVGDKLGLSEDAARKRVDRAVEKLRTLLAGRGVATAAATLGTVLSTNAVQTAPAGLAAAVSATALAGTAATNATVIAATTNTIAMTTLQKTLVAATVAVLAGAGIYEARQAAKWRDQVSVVQRQQVPLTEELQQLRQERDETARQLRALREENERLNGNTGELLKLRSEVAALRRNKQAVASGGRDVPNPPAALPLNKGFGALGEFLSATNVFNAGTTTPEALLQTLVWAILEGKLERLAEIGAPIGGQNQPGEVVGELSESEATVFKMMRNAFTNCAGFRLSSKLGDDGRRYNVRLDAEPLTGGGNINDYLKNFNLSFVIEHSVEGWRFGNPFEGSDSK